MASTKFGYFALRDVDASLIHHASVRTSFLDGFGRCFGNQRKSRAYSEKNYPTLPHHGQETAQVQEPEPREDLLNRLKPEYRRLGVAVVDFFAEFDQFLFKRQETIADGVRQIHLIHRRVRQTLALCLDHASRHTDHRRIGWNVPQHY